MRNPSKRLDGFTVIELLVAAAITIVLVGLLLAVTRGTLDLWQKSRDQSAANGQTKIALEIIARDLRSLIYREAGEVTLALDIVDAGGLGAHGWRQDETAARKADTVSILTPATDLSGRFRETARFGRGGVWLRLFTTDPRSGGGAPAMVSYQICRRPISGPVNASNPPPVRYTLYRLSLSGEDSFSRGCEVTAADSLLTLPNTDDALCDNVVDFGLWCYRENSDGTLTSLYPVEPQDRDFRGANEQFPDVVDVMLRVMTDHGAEQLAQMEAGRVVRPSAYATNEDWWWGVVAEQSRVYTLRVRLVNGGAP